MDTLKDICIRKKDEMGLSSASIAEKSGFPQSTVRSFFGETSKSPSVYTAGAICKVLGISIDEYFGISEQLPPQDAETMEGLRHGIRVRDYLLFSILAFNFVLLIAAIAVHAVYY